MEQISLIEETLRHKEDKMNNIDSNVTQLRKLLEMKDSMIKSK